MDYFEISSLPRLLFAHFYQADNYQNSFSPAKNYLEISYIYAGSLDVEIGGRVYHAEKGDVLCLFRDRQTTVWANDFHCHHTVAALLDWRACGEGQDALLLPILTPAAANTTVICRLIDDFSHHQAYYETAKTLGATKFLELLCAIDQCGRKSQGRNLPGELLYAQKAKRYILQNLHSPIAQKAIAAHLGISPEYLCFVFKKAEGCSVIQYVNRLKLENIKALMDHAGLHLYEAAAAYGYKDPNYVSRLFKQLFGYNITDKPRIQSSDN